MVFSIIGAHYGDEGKGLAVDYFAARRESVLVIRHNGGAQSGHTVETKSQRFVFHELSSGSFRRADTFWAETYLPDLYKLAEEMEAFRVEAGFVPGIYADPDCCITTIDDVLINMLLEDLRGDARHGSCGMGINEADLRTKAGYGISFKRLMELASKTMEGADLNSQDVSPKTEEAAEELCSELKRIRLEYSYKRLAEIVQSAQTEACMHFQKDADIDEVDVRLHNSKYYELLHNDEVLRNYAYEVMANLRFVRVESLRNLFPRYSNHIFEAGQGLRLDGEYPDSQPHVTASRTGLTNVIRILDSIGRQLDEVVYVSRTYGTKHGAGPLKNEDSRLENKLKLQDRTNIYNPWQGSIRYYRWDDADDFMKPIYWDLAQCPDHVKKSLFITHLNETNQQMIFRNGEMSVKEFAKKTGLWEKLYLSASPYGDEVEEWDE